MEMGSAPPMVLPTVAEFGGRVPESEAWSWTKCEPALNTTDKLNGYFI